MSIAGLMQLLLETTVASSLALLLALALRRPLRVTFGARIAYGVWALVPIALLAVLLPAASVPLAVTLLPTVVFGGEPMTAAATVAAPPPDLRPLLAAWLLGVAAVTVVFAFRQRRFHAGLGRLQQRHRGLQQADAVDGLPAAIGWWRPAVVLPADFELRYDVQQQALILAHERAHIARGDLHANALVAALRCLFWFNPLLHYAARRFGHDQELACDAQVIAHHPQARRSYGEALLQAQFATLSSPLGCHFGFGHPLKERIAMLRQPVPSSLRWLLGSALVTALTLGAGLTAWAAQPAAAREAVAPLPPPPPALPPPPPPALPAPPASAAMPAPPAPPAPPAAPQAEVPAPPAPPATPAKFITRTAPAFPAAANKQGIDGMVLLVVDITADGHVAHAVVEKSQPAGVFDAAALDAVRTWKFTPATKAGKAVAAKVRVPITFVSEPPAAAPTAPSGSA